MNNVLICQIKKWEIKTFYKLRKEIEMYRLRQYNITEQQEKDLYILLNNTK